METMVQDIRRMEALLQNVARRSSSAEMRKRDARQVCDQKKAQAENDYQRQVGLLDREEQRVRQNVSVRYAERAKTPQSIEDEFRKNLGQEMDIRRRYHAEILRCESIVDQTSQKLAQLPQATVDRCRRLATVGDVSMDEGELFALFDKILRKSFLKSLFRMGGYYPRKLMIRDFILGAEKKSGELSARIEQLETARDREILQNQRRAARIKADSEVANRTLKQQIEDGARTELRQIASKRQIAMQTKRQLLDEAERTYRQELQDCDSKIAMAKADLVKFESSDLVKGFVRRSAAMLKGTGAMSADWKAPNYVANSTCGTSYTIGNKMIPSSIQTAEHRQLLERSFPNVFVGGAFKVPMLVEKTAPLKICFQYDDTSVDAVSEAVQFFILQKMRCNLKENLKIFFADPTGRGRNMGVLVAPPEENKIIGLESINTKDSIRNKLTELSDKLDEITGLLGDCNSIAEYNLTAQRRIAETVLVLFDVESCLDSGAVGELKVIWDNAARCGITILLASKKPIRELGIKDGRAIDDFSFLNCDDSYYATFVGGKQTITYRSQSYAFQPGAVGKDKQEFIKAFRTDCVANRKVKNSFTEFFDATKAYSYKDATQGIRLPIMVRNEPGGELCEFVLGTGLSTHTLVTGTTRSGKSSFLHMLISSIVMQYHPDDVELWLVDYGCVEFRKYLSLRPPHVRFVSLDKSDEFTYSFLHYLKKVFSERERLFGNAGVTNIAEYRQKFGPRSMPRILMIVDEFHVMTQAAQAGGTEYKKMLENALTEYGKFGFSCVFSNQTCSALSGLSETGKLQLKNRVALFNSLAEMKETLSVGADNYTPEMLWQMERTGIGEFWYKEYRSDNDFELNCFKAVYINDAQRDQVIRTSIARGETVAVDTEVYELDGTARCRAKLAPIRASLAQLEEECRKNPARSYFRAFVGDPCTIKPLFYFDMEKKKNNQNIAVLGNGDSLLESVLTYLAKSAEIQNMKVVVMASPWNDVLTNLKRVNTIWSNCEVLDSFGSICAKIAELHGYVERKQPLPEDTVVFWLGFSELHDEFSISLGKSQYLERIKAEGEGAKKTGSDSFVVKDVENKLDDPILLEQAQQLGMSIMEIIEMFSGGQQDGLEETAPDSNDDEAVYNATEDVLDLFSRGGKLGLINAVCFSSYFEKKRISALSLDPFVHRIAFAMSKSEVYEWGLPQKATELERDKVALYTDGVVVERFRPYLLN